jgi:3-hydroxyisobutyrate dehydrogenase
MDEESNASGSCNEKIAVIGLGQMGYAIALNLHDRGWPVIGCDPCPDARERVEGCMEVFSSIGEVGQVGMAVLSLPGSGEVEVSTRHLVEATNCSLVVDTSTSVPETSRSLAEWMRSQGRSFIDAPVSGGTVLARAGTLSAFVGGFPEDVAAATRVLHAITGGKWRHMGDPGSGNVTKLMNNIMVASHLLVTAEALSIGMAYGLDPQDITQAISASSGRSAVVEVNLPQWILNDGYDSAFTYRLMARDARLALEVAGELGLEVPVLRDVADRWQDLEQSLSPNDDFNRAVPVFMAQTGCVRPIRHSNN